MINKDNLRKSNPENVRRLARWMKLRETDSMSIRQVIRLLAWYFTRAKKRMRNLTWY